LLERKLPHILSEPGSLICKALGNPNHLDAIKTAPLRTTEIDQTYSDQLLIIGEAAGLVDPLTAGKSQHNDIN
jgi:hypothetical protein